ncbi:hypothetical protein SAMD00019534_031520 [Acytostelium subglobosum LB1]|uniref:hypothetical protein n=1 Tax=Acytostelium subglobosum LB1 TaxID=1410327 RepID=UPI0006449738|nr:hypothetical protein SAMD00019534_031520 [Acytostelium subglobosum LB1]GAM19977.1 hypothetical protein SAMD00019534_031520 [Acytostelium subglobosum LB1]|eukprot:XP_012756739.1 hypothetical protein SAMD00019534_031520 [Acytostelium subglobosum LB1]
MERTKSLLLCILLLGIVYGQRPNSFTISVSLFDQYPEYNPNFEADNSRHSGVIPGLVNYNLDPITKIPTLSPNADTVDGLIVNKPKFAYFFANQPGITDFMSYDLTFTLSGSSGIYQVDNQVFFPFDYKGFDTDASKRIYQDGDGNYHNFHFCMKMNSYFTYVGNEVFNFRGDDDVWVFIDNKLAVDLGGVHSAASKNITLKTLGLTAGNTYAFDFYYCERHTTTSTIRIDTNLAVKCLTTDYCGICNGDGSSCCNAAASCNDNDPCTIDKCPSVTTPGITSSNWKTFCTHTQMTCSQNNTCTNYGCVAGTCQKTSDKTCPALSCKTLDKCDVSLGGCQYKPKCVAPDACTNVVCNPTTQNCDSTTVNCNGTDKFCTDYSCDKTKGCISNPKTCIPQTGAAPCTVYSCAAGVGCQTKLLNSTECGCCDPTKTPKCKVATCDTKTGTCVYSNVNTDDGNPCTVDTCDATTGVISHTPVKCSGCQTCTQAAGGCTDTATQCNNGNVCNVGVCTNGTCSYVPNTCDDGNPCTDDSCDPLNGCAHTATTCPDLGLCQIGACSTTGGCGLTNRTCTQPTDFCQDVLCDPRLGCITFAKTCVPSNPDCQYGVCNNGTQKCEFHDYSPLPFGCNKAAVISTGVIAAIVVAGAVALAIMIFGGKKGYDYWKNSRDHKIASLNSNPLYTQNPASGNNPMYGNN